MVVGAADIIHPERTHFAVLPNGALAGTESPHERDDPEPQPVNHGLHLRIAVTTIKARDIGIVAKEDGLLEVIAESIIALPLH
jgi:hypothetical protein